MVGEWVDLLMLEIVYCGEVFGVYVIVLFKFEECEFVFITVYP
ncbi:MAG: hypothetical protein ACLFVB_09650 [Thermoplasmata archaeon]